MTKNKFLLLSITFLLGIVLTMPVFSMHRVGGSGSGGAGPVCVGAVDKRDQFAQREQRFLALKMQLEEVKQLAFMIKAELPHVLNDTADRFTWSFCLFRAVLLSNYYIFLGAEDSDFLQYANLPIREISISELLFLFLNVQGNSDEDEELHEEVELLLNEGASSVAIDERGRTPLHYAAANGHCSAVKTLLEKGADRNARDNDGNTPMDLLENAIREKGISDLKYATILSLLV